MPKTLTPRQCDPTGEDRRVHLPGANLPGSPVETRRQLVVKLSWMLLWMVYLMYPIQDLTGPRHGVPAKIAGAVALTVFVGTYLGLVAFRSMKGIRRTVDYVAIGAMLLLAIATSVTLGDSWLTLFTYTSVCVAAVLPTGQGLRGVVGVTVVAAIVSVPAHADKGTLVAILLPTLLSGVAMGGLQRLVTTMRELREARAAVAHLAASEERLRLARDLHDLLGHSLSLIAIKSELAGRFMDQDQQEAARAQVADIETVARQSLADVREAVSGFRRPTLPVELAAARTALTAAQIRLDVDPAMTEGRAGLGTEESGALAWALREAVTNIVRHGADASVCTVTLDEAWEGEGERYAVLDVTDNGRGPGKSTPGNGLSGLEERLALLDGRLETGTGPSGKGFRLRAYVPLRRVSAATADSLPE